ncbi:hypothetical protein BDF14DRAFT_1803373 [Spinellus fusiger]|nr:hypothetical protein BDF14DRAFT_1803373 [Spinellus fusiger]
MPSKLVNHNYSRRTEPEGGFKTREEFYPFYLGEHCNIINRRLHILATTISVICFILSIIKSNPKLILAGLFQGYGFAWIGHFVFEKNKPATFRYPVWSFLSDFQMWQEIVSGKRPF